MNWKRIKSVLQKSNDDRWTQHPAHHLKNKKRGRRNKKESK